MTMQLPRAALLLMCTALIAACSSSGAPGPAGAQGPTGAPGPTGDPGGQGIAGSQGEPGPTGATGPTGSAGAEGATGPQGLQGPQGAVLVIDGGVVTGPPGASVLVTPISAGGAICAAGGVRVTQLSDGGISNVCNGVAGQAGATGPQGVSGTAGAPGATGSTGASGVAGTAGPMGPQGPPGAVLYLDGGVVVQPSSPIQFAGYTTAQFNGNLGSPTGANQKCQAQFTGSYFCTIADFDVANTGSYPPAGGAWIDAPRQSGGERSTESCNSNGAWTYGGTSASGADLNDAGTVYEYLGCQTVMPLACCRGGAQTVVFRGYTTAAYSGNLGGTQGANQKCQSQYAGTFFCTIDDFDNANTSAAPSVAAWVDGPRQASGQRAGVSCNSNGGWTYGGTDSSGSDLNDAGTLYEFMGCQTLLPLACCQNQ